MSKPVPPSSTVADPSQPPRLAALDPEVNEILGPPPILDGEDLDAYNGLHDRMRSVVSPEDFIEEIWVRDVVDLTWEILRLRRLKAKLMAAETHQGLDRLLNHLVSYEEGTSALVEGWVHRDPRSVKRVDKIMADAGFDRQTLHALTLVANLDQFERIDRMTTQAEARRNSVFREIDRHRDVIARRLRDAVTDIEDAEFEDASAVKLAPTQ